MNKAKNNELYSDKSVSVEQAERENKYLIESVISGTHI